MIARDEYLNKLINKQNNDKIKIITGLRRVGKSVLLFDLYYNHLMHNGIKPENIIKIQLDTLQGAFYRDIFELINYVKAKITTDENYYLFIDEIQLIKPKQVNDEIIGIYELLNELANIKNLDVYVTGSNSKMLSSDIATEFRGRGDIIKVYPLSFKEFLSTYKHKNECFKDFLIYGSMPKTAALQTKEEKKEYLISLVNNVYIKDIIERYKLRNNKNVLDDLLKVLSSTSGSLTNSARITNYFKNNMQINIAPATINNYLDMLCESFLLDRVSRYDVRGLKHIGSPLKYYFADSGLRNAFLNFSEINYSFLMENVIYNDLIRRGYSVSVGVVESYDTINESKKRINYEVDFVAQKDNEKYYIQAVYALNNDTKITQESKSFNRIRDSYKKIIVTNDNIDSYYNSNGYFYVNVQEFLLMDKF
ncbi:ATP-binding protein [Mycoplasmopsis opalescens]|uniref:ATP-binding protein n=1 Tax=Mycoplasmopsis opalescens TaxID=114886 RepID=UPI000A7EE740|nr:ATP-binding protein [Mycoplasmopsis opalescens]